MFETHSHTQCLRRVEMAKPSLYRPGEAEWQRYPLVQALILAVWAKINILSFLLLDCPPLRTSNRQELSPSLVLYKIKALRFLGVVQLVLTRPEPIWPS